MNSTPMAFFEGKYTIVSDGNIISHSKNTCISPTKNSNGYLKYTFCLNGKKSQQLIHRVVAKHLLPNPYEYPQVNHKDGNKENNRVDNLEWCSVEQNIQHSLETGLRKGYMSADDKEIYLSLVLTGTQVKDLAKDLGRRPETLHKMLRTTAERVGMTTQWKTTMRNNRVNAALRNLTKINN